MIVNLHQWDVEVFKSLYLEKVLGNPEFSFSLSIGKNKTGQYAFGSKGCGHHF